MATDLWVVTVGGEVTSKLTAGAHAGFPDWSPSGDRIVYSEFVDGYFELRTIKSDGTGSPELLLPSGGADRLAPAWSPDATQVAFVKYIYPEPNGVGGVSEVWLVGADGAAPLRLADAPGGGCGVWRREASPGGGSSVIGSSGTTAPTCTPISGRAPCPARDVGRVGTVAQPGSSWSTRS